MKNNLSIHKSVKICGGLSAISKILGLSPPTIHQWITGRRPIPIHHCVLIERVMGGMVTRRDLRPDDWWKIWPKLVDGAGSRPSCGGGGDCVDCGGSDADGGTGGVCGGDMSKE